MRPRKHRELTATVDPPPGYRYLAARLLIPSAGQRLVDELIQDGWRISLDADADPNRPQTFIRRYKAFLGGLTTRSRLTEAGEYFSRKLCEHDCFGDVDIEEWVANYRVVGNRPGTAHLKVHRIRRTVVQVPGFARRMLNQLGRTSLSFWLFIAMPALTAIVSAYLVGAKPPQLPGVVSPQEIFWTGLNTIPLIIRVGFPLLAVAGFLVTGPWLRLVPIPYGMGFTASSIMLSLVLYYGFSQLPRERGWWLALCAGVAFLFLVAWVVAGKLSTSDLTVTKALSMTSAGWLGGGASVFGLYKGVEFEVDYYFADGLGLSGVQANLAPYTIVRIAFPALVITGILLAAEFPFLRFTAQLTSKTVGLMVVALIVAVTVSSGLQSIASQARWAGRQVVATAATPGAKDDLPTLCIVDNRPRELMVTRLQNGYAVL